MNLSFASGGTVTINGVSYSGQTVRISGDVESVSGDVNAQIIHGKVKTISGNIRGAK